MNLCGSDKVGESNIGKDEYEDETPGLFERDSHHNLCRYTEDPYKFQKKWKESIDTHHVCLKNSQLVLPTKETELEVWTHFTLAAWARVYSDKCWGKQCH